MLNDVLFSILSAAFSSAENAESQDKVAIKKISKAFEDIVDAKRILREIKLLQHFDHENVITIVDLLPPASVTEFEDVYIISDLMETDLHRIIYSRQPLTDDHIQYFLYQVVIFMLQNGELLVRSPVPTPPCLFCC